MLLRPGTALALIASERHRHVFTEGWTPEHDDEHDAGELAAAGAAYALAAADMLNPHSQGDGGYCEQAPDCWPWSPNWWKPLPGSAWGDRIRELVKAGSLIVAEIERIQRAQGVPLDATDDGGARVDAFLAEVRAELVRARKKFPGDRVMTVALAEEFGELCKAVLEEPRANVRKEAVQTAVMAARVVLDGDSSVNAWREEQGLDALTPSRGAAEVGRNA